MTLNMTENKKRFWKNFTWKKFIYFVVVLFIATLAVNLIWNYFDGSENVRDVFTVNEMVRRFCLSIIVGLILTILIDYKKTDSA